MGPLRRLLFGSAAKGAQALPKLVAIAAPLVVGFLDNKLGWNLTQFLGPDGGDALYPLIAAYLGWRVPMRTAPTP